MLLTAPCLLAQQPANSITVTVSGGSVAWSAATGNALKPGSMSNPGNLPVSVAASWNLQPIKDLQLYAYFTSSSAAMAGANPLNPASIPSAAVQISVNGGAFTAVSGTVPFGAPGAGLQLWTLRITGGNRNSSRNDTLAFNLDLAALPELPPDTYSGTLILQAQAVP